MRKKKKRVKYLTEPLVLFFLVLAVAGIGLAEAPAPVRGGLDYWKHPPIKVILTVVVPTVTPTATEVFTPSGTSPTFTVTFTTTPQTQTMITVTKAQASVVPTAITSPVPGFVTDLEIIRVSNQAPATVATAKISHGYPGNWATAWSVPDLPVSAVSPAGSFILEGQPFLSWGIGGTPENATVNYTVRARLRRIGVPFPGSIPPANP